jgi:3'-phosphoadenosine 5'-phosphosulfate sulfotransferase (PAPS reductase)/FAD synthetase
VAWLVAQEHGRENTVLLFNDTKAEHPDADRFRKQVSEFIGVPITEVSDGRSLWEVIEDEHCLPSYHIPFCTGILKLKPTEKYLSEQTDFMLYNGLGMEEWARVQRATVRAESLGRKLICPLFERRFPNDEVKRIIRDEWKICLPQPYQHLEHNNCIPCFKAGKGHWYKVWKYYPMSFIKAMQMEEKIGHTVFKDITLAELGRQWEQTRGQVEFDFADDAVPCMCAI